MIYSFYSSFFISLLSAPLLKQAASRVLAMVFSAWGMESIDSQRVAEKVGQPLSAEQLFGVTLMGMEQLALCPPRAQITADFQFDQAAGLLGKAGLTGWGKYMLPIWSCCALAYQINPHLLSMVVCTPSNAAADTLQNMYHVVHIPAGRLPGVDGELFLSR